MALDYAHEKPDDLTDKTLDLRRAVASMIEEFEAATWYQERIDACKGPRAQSRLGPQPRRGEGACSHALGVDSSKRLGPGKGAQGLHVHRRAAHSHRGPQVEAGRG